MIYVPLRRAIMIQNLQAAAAYGGFYFDPVAGDRTVIERFQVDAAGTRTIAPPSFDHDWVLVLQKAK
jgi:hypothetical protein